ncbi:MAG: type II toxin-antitoxin system VapC family toxin [Endozoicomonas sp.]|uniref:type II toxin-antitoxin system VapC family toxin n=1 Tax=Endozoicomonas sp. TaxID=1892382 RepID=UPI003D9B2244
MIVLDTHTLIWWVSDHPSLSKKARKCIDTEQKNKGDIVVSSISAWEIAMLTSKGHLTLSIDIDSWLKLVGEIDRVTFLPIDNRVAVESTRLPGEFHKDPADRIITAQARALSAPLVTADEKILKYSHVKTIW